jgi:Lon protease-like protein
MTAADLGPALTPAERRLARRVQRSGRASGDPRVDRAALARLERAARRERTNRLVAVLPLRRLTAAECLERLRCTMRHPSRTGVPTAASWSTHPGTS